MSKSELHGSNLSAFAGFIEELDIAPPVTIKIDDNEKGMSTHELWVQGKVFEVTLFTKQENPSALIKFPTNQLGFNQLDSFKMASYVFQEVCPDYKHPELAVRKAYDDDSVVYDLSQELGRANFDSSPRDRVSSAVYYLPANGEHITYAYGFFYKSGPATEYLKLPLDSAKNLNNEVSKQIVWRHIDYLHGDIDEEAVELMHKISYICSR